MCYHNVYIFGLHLYIYIRKTRDITFTRIKKKLGNRIVLVQYPKAKLWYLLLQLSDILSVILALFKNV